MAGGKGHSQRVGQGVGFHVPERASRAGACRGCLRGHRGRLERPRGRQRAGTRPRRGRGRARAAHWPVWRWQPELWPAPGGVTLPVAQRRAAEVPPEGAEQELAPSPATAPARPGGRRPSTLDERLGGGCGSGGSDCLWVWRRRRRQAQGGSRRAGGGRDGQKRRRQGRRQGRRREGAGQEGGEGGDGSPTKQVERVAERETEAQERRRKKEVEVEERRRKREADLQMELDPGGGRACRRDHLVEGAP